MDFLKALFDGNERDVKRYRKIVEKVNALEPQFEKLSDEALSAKTDEFRKRVADEVGTTDDLDPKKMREKYDTALDKILPEAFAACREAAKRVLGMRHYDVQLIGGMVQHDGRISELRTGEGKTLMSTLATYLNALAGQGVHLVTANDYLVKRDAVWMGPLFHRLGMTVGILQGSSPETGDSGGQYIYDPEWNDPDPRFRHARPCERGEAYACDITYGTSSEFGFDYLRDNMAPSLSAMVQRPHYFAIVDECDSNLIDEARTPLIISGQADKSSDLYYKMDRIIPILEKGEAKKDKEDTTTDEKDFTVDEKARTAVFTERGLEKVERALGIDNISDAEHLEEMQYAVAALKAHAVFVKDRDYVVRENREGKPEVVIVDEFTGRLMFGRRWSDGLHQAIEAKEGIQIENEQQTLATITIQNYFRLYAKLAGMTGTAKTEEDEFRKIYALDVVQVPTNKPMQRKDFPDIIYKTEEAKLRGITAEILALYCREQPVLVGTRSIEMSERVSRRLEFQQLEVLGAILLLREALENKRKEIGGDAAEQISTFLNTPTTELTVPALAPIAKQLGVSLKMLNQETFERLAVLLGVAEPLEKTKPEFREGRKLVLDRLVAALQSGIVHNILNAKYHEQEARIIAEAGRKGAVTIATNMAGRGVDILLGGTLHRADDEGAPVHASTLDNSFRRGGRRSVGHTVGRNDQVGDPELLGPAGAGTLALEDGFGAGENTPHDVAQEREEVRKLGGLFILGTERHESRRIDNQLRGRSGRQGDPGASRFHVSLEDYLWRVFGDRNQGMLMKQWDESEAVDTPILSKMIERAQKKVEQHNFDSRKHVLEYDDVMNVQRKVIYAERAKILKGAHLRDTLTDFLHGMIDTEMLRYCNDDLPREEWDIEGLYSALAQRFPVGDFIDEETMATLNRRDLAERLHQAADDAFDAKEREMRHQMVDAEMSRWCPDAIDPAEWDRSALYAALCEQFDLAEFVKEEELQSLSRGALLEKLHDAAERGTDSAILREIERSVTRQQIDQAWVHHLANMDYLREGIGLRGYGQTDPLVAYKKEAQELFNELQAGIQEEVVGNLFRATLQFQDEMSLFEQMGAFDDAAYFDGNDLPAGYGDELPDVGQGMLLAAAAQSAQRQATQPRVGPNDPCPCGSGKKYKRCCRNK